MKVFKSIFLSADKGYKLHDKSDNSVCAAVQLPIDSDLSVWEEITEEEAKLIEEGTK